MELALGLDRVLIPSCGPMLCCCCPCRRVERMQATEGVYGAWLAADVVAHETAHQVGMGTEERFGCVSQGMQFAQWQFAELLFTQWQSLWLPHSGELPKAG